MMTEDHLLALCRSLGERQTISLTVEEAEAIFGVCSAPAATTFLRRSLGDAVADRLLISDLDGVRITRRS